jgi:hypothetical protein
VSDTPKPIRLDIAQQAATLRLREGAKRFTVAGEIWSVYEDTRTEVPFLGPALVFESDQAVRRVRQYPANWRELSDEKLYALSWSR